MLPILISLSLAPGSYFFWANAGVATTTATAAIEARITRLLIASSIMAAVRGVGFICLRSPPPCGEASGVGVLVWCEISQPTTTPLPSPPPQGGREQSVLV